MKDKVFKIIKGVLLMLPLIFVGSVSLYTIINENAKDSYSAEVSYKYKTNIVNDYTTDLVRGNIYHCVLNELPTQTSNYLPFTASALYNFQQLSYYVTDTISESHYILFEARNNILQVRDEGYSGLFGQSYTVPFTPVEFDFVYFGTHGLTGNPNFTISSSNFNILTSNNLNGYLDNAFEYSLTKFNDIGFGKIDFLEWFNELFLTNNFNNVYSRFINSYLNYFLFVELVMFIPSVFHWVIHFFTEIGNNSLSRSSKKKKGDE